MRLALIILLLLALAGVLFATQPLNMDDVAFAIPFTGDPGLQFTGPRLIVVAATFLIGFALGYFATLPGRIGAARRARRAEKRLGEVEATRGAAASAEARAAEARREAAVAREEAAEARASGYDAAETQRLADEVARRTADVQRNPPPPPPPER
ncbi:MAG TPA: lipopolysaccharide assembly protein LapA domain-containing protein [Rubricoccaceae bacterium]|nr:lipopolysaccharide assembly protein LapA domain-containing protein [Rubricoccaceae bacterium]